MTKLVSPRGVEYLYSAEKISGRQGVYLLITTVLPGLLFSPAIIYGLSDRSGWLTVLLAAALVLIQGLAVARLGEKYPRLTLVQYSQVLVGKMLGTAAGMVLILVFLYYAALLTRKQANLLTTMFMPNTPPIIFSISILLVSAYAIRNGLEVLARANELTLPIVLSFLFFVIFAIAPEMKWEHLTPVLEDGFMTVLKGVPTTAYFLAFILALSMLAPQLNKAGQLKGVVYRTVIAICFLQLVTFLSVTAVFGPRSDRLVFPVFVLARQINIADLIERVEPFIMLMWILSGFVSIGVLYYCVILALAQIFNLVDYRFLVLPTGVLLTSLSITMWEGSGQFLEQLILWSPYLAVMLVGLPLLLLAISFFRSGEGKTLED